MNQVRYRARQKLPELISVKEAEEVLKKSRTVVMRLIHTEAVAAVFVGGGWVIGKSSLDEYLEYDEQVNGKKGPEK